MLLPQRYPFFLAITIANFPKVELHVHFDGAFDTSLVFAEAKALQARGELSGLPEEVDIFGETLRVRDAVILLAHHRLGKNHCNAIKRRELWGCPEMCRILCPVICLS